MRALLSAVLSAVLGVALIQSTPPRAQEVASAAAPAPLPSVTLPPELDRVLRDYERAWRARDAGVLADLFAADGFVLGNGRPPVRGRDAIRVAYAGSGGSLSLRALNYSAEDSVGFIIGAFARQAGEPDIGKFALLLRRHAGGPWLIAADIDNGNAPPSPRPPGRPPAIADSTRRPPLR